MTIEQAAADILSSKKYQLLCPDTVVRILTQEWGRHKKPKQAVERTRERLHGICGAYLAPQVEKQASTALAAGDVQKALALHASTRERLDTYPQLYQFVFENNLPARVLDIACGLNPLMLHRQGVASVWGCDIHQGLGNVLTPYAQKHGWDFTFALHDVLCAPVAASGDMALVFKLLPLLEREQPGAALALLRTLDAPVICVSFPTRSLGGRGKGMHQHYATWFEGLVAPHFTVQHHTLIGDELLYRIQPNPA
ncbi:RmtH family 16S rRNA (guanine(1405)-N(7))-methyltransferase [Klebsiella variicola]|uniref:16S rRNA (guanine(1405)-N(7))-methyltransferase n=2 Tax=Klebsiella pneumoniae TaxID=573 RepID=M4Q6L3_KLEPN|nr:MULTISPECIES: RmtH family 16S rRNA (guanine(1405)-N(7))-methyltransferase [Enterobacteriaceae]AGH19769.1 RmtH [Klebsiella pneumoniae]KKJ61241.1 16S rRNA methyltransferase [Klebsiella pneumoniae MRSN 2404]MBZ1993278.1 RmtH family 16S rRNA (guanine(1405)-N(7))-methyltransferase [Klebsiella pneumoniae]MCJ1959014.1 RmtH family 16S rRNA (guanine(1405)-N(7))-methyltransferase [Klebsiella variicola]OAA10525.1 16S rRNA (guanine(1405)-N(7))-methyltransferase [Klebsiella pneumoniae]